MPACAHFFLHTGCNAEAHLKTSVWDAPEVLVNAQAVAPGHHVCLAQCIRLRGYLVVALVQPHHFLPAAEVASGKRLSGPAHKPWACVVINISWKIRSSRCRRDHLVRAGSSADICNIFCHMSPPPRVSEVFTGAATEVCLYGLPLIGAVRVWVFFLSFLRRKLFAIIVHFQYAVVNMTSLRREGLPITPVYLRAAFVACSLSAAEVMVG